MVQLNITEKILRTRIWRNGVDSPFEAFRRKCSVGKQTGGIQEGHKLYLFGIICSFPIYKKTFPTLCGNTSCSAAFHRRVKSFWQSVLLKTFWKSGVSWLPAQTPAGQWDRISLCRSYVQQDWHNYPCAQVLTLYIQYSPHLAGVGSWTHQSVVPRTSSRDHSLSTLPPAILWHRGCLQGQPKPYCPEFCTPHLLTYRTCWWVPPRSADFLTTYSAILVSVSHIPTSNWSFLQPVTKNKLSMGISPFFSKKVQYKQLIMLLCYTLKNLIKSYKLAIMPLTQ